MKTGRDINIIGTTLWVETIDLNVANRPNLVFLHDGLGCTATWKDFPAYLCQILGLNGLLYDRQGHGMSAGLNKKRKKDYLHIEALEVLPQLLNSMGIHKPILIGHSDGGTIALLYAAHYPVSAIITEAAHIYVEAVTIKGIQKAVKLYYTTAMKEKLIKYHGNKTDALFHAWADTWLDSCFTDWNIQNVLPKVDCSALIIQGEDDPYATRQQWQDIINQLNGPVEELWLEQCGHNPHKEKPEMVQKAIIEFINNLINPPSP